MSNERDPELESGDEVNAEFDSDDVDAQVVGADAEDEEELEHAVASSTHVDMEDEMYSEGQLEPEVDDELSATDDSEPSESVADSHLSETEDEFEEEVSLNHSEGNASPEDPSDEASEIAADDFDHSAAASGEAPPEPDFSSNDSSAGDHVDTKGLSDPKGPFPRAIFRETAAGEVIIDATAGRSSIFGFGFAPVAEAISLAAQGYLGDSAAHDERDEPISQLGDHWSQTHAVTHSERSSLEVELRNVLDDQSISLDSLFVRPSADSAVDSAIGIVRRERAEKGYRTIALVGSDHGRTGLCRSASGSPALHEEFGPMMAGFTHVPVGDIDALRAAIDDQTVCVLMSPVDFDKSASPCNADYLNAVRACCDEHSLALVIDETQLVIGAAGTLFHFQSIAPIQADMVLLAAGLFGGLPGGLILASEFAAGTSKCDVERFPLQAAVAEETLSAMRQQHLPTQESSMENAFAVALAQVVNGFQFVRDIHATGRTIGIETDLESTDLVRTAHSCGLHVAASGNNGILMQLPLVLGDEECEQVLSRLTKSLEAMERMTTELAN